jgi:hypothetical protein
MTSVRRCQADVPAGASVGAGVLRGDLPLSHWHSAGDGFLLDVREQAELAVEQLTEAEAFNIPL